MMGSRADVVVIGGGIVGTSAAAFCAEAGARTVLVEREGLAAGASGANSGVVQHPLDPVLADLYRSTLALYRDLAAADAGFRIAAEPAGMLYVSRDEGAARRMGAEIDRLFPELAWDVLAGAALQSLGPALAPDLWACRVGIGFPVAPAASTYAYATLAERAGATVRLGRSALPDVRDDAVVGVVVDGETIAAGAVLVAAGPWTPAALDPSGRWEPIHPRWGVVVEVDLPAGPRYVMEEAEIDAAIGTAQDGAPLAFDPDEAIEDFSLVPLGAVASVGSTFLAREPDPDAWIEPLLLRASTFVPSVADAPIRGTRSCARPQSLDGRPLVGAVPGTRDLFVCAGHGSWGISTGPASARLVTDLMLGRGTAVPAELDAGRFGGPA
jgi:glycine/D-amino acid oxidase-like deaminating enzyme